MLESLCAPAILYVAFSITQIIIDIFKNMYNTAFLKFIVMIIFTIVLNILCERGLGVVSWFIVFIPFITMTIITSLLLFVFGLSPSSGSLNYNVVENPSQQAQTPTPTQMPITTPAPAQAQLGQNIVQSYPSNQSYLKSEPYSPESVPTTMPMPTTMPPTMPTTTDTSAATSSTAKKNN